MIGTRNEQVRDGGVGTEGAAKVETRSDLYTLMYGIAKEHRDLAKKAAGKDIHSMNEEIKESMISILFSYTCLEAYINTIGKHRLGNDWQRFEGKKVSTESKWKGVSKALASGKTGKQRSIFNNDEEPFKSFLNLTRIRIHDLVHWKAEFGNVVQTKYGRTEGTINVLNCDKADWACKTVKNMVIKLNESIDNPPSTSWLD